MKYPVVVTFLCIVAVHFGSQAAVWDFSTVRAFGNQEFSLGKPIGKLTLVDDTFFGVCDSGGRHGKGAVFKVSIGGSKPEVIYSFGASPESGEVPRAGLTLASDGLLYGTTLEGGLYKGGTVYSIHPNGTQFKVLRSFGVQITDGGALEAPVIEGSDGMLYGTARSGGSVGVLA